MGVVVNEFEVVSEDEQAGTPANGETAAAPEASTPFDIGRIMQRQAERAERVWAH